jgi:hypothetical protein
MAQLSRAWITGSYLAFMQDNELTLEYAGTTDIPANILDLPVKVVAQGTATQPLIQADGCAAA